DQSLKCKLHSSSQLWKGQKYPLLILILLLIMAFVVRSHMHLLTPDIECSHLDPEFVYVTTTMSWSNAQSYCRNNFVDLATIKNDTEHQRVQSLIPGGQYPWIGLYRDANLHWSDGSSVLFTSWDSFSIVIGSRKVICGATSTGISGRWKIVPCETRLPFVCYGPPGECLKIKRRKKEAALHTNHMNSKFVLISGT
uniref:C-type lectin domain-containing protein n=1 Tax=Cyprinodon variegatus TaxID=28743 RepID=A0A3Q2D3L0_CYPVA